ncbi:MAG: hypothetical protein K6B74_02725 [Ruminococcus sp.]|nr:hypothetical protein [Ruminococcus sp.]
MDMKKTMMKVGIMISLANGIVLGALFSSIGMAKSPAGIIPMGVLTSVLLSAVISVIVGLIIPMKIVTEKVNAKLGIDPARQKALACFVEGLVGDFIFTPILCTFFVFKNYFQHNLPPQVPIVPYWLKELGLDLLIALPITMIIVPLVRKQAFKILGVPAGRPPQERP